MSSFSLLPYPGIHAGDRKQDGPGEEPYWQEDFDHHTEKANEEIGVHAVRVDNVIVVRLEDPRLASRRCLLKEAESSWTELEHTCGVRKSP